MYQSETDATASSFVTGPHWGICSMPACCSARVLVRLEAGYESTQHDIDAVGMETIPWQGYNNDEFIKAAASVKRNTRYGLPLDHAFGVVLGNLRAKEREPGYGSARDFVFFASDNTAERPGDDVHRGPFSTKGFIEWAHVRQYIRLGQAENSYLQGYTFVLAPDIDRILQRIRNSFRRYINPLIEASPYNEHMRDDWDEDDWMNEEDW